MFLCIRLVLILNFNFQLHSKHEIQILFSQYKELHASYHSSVTIGATTARAAGGGAGATGARATGAGAGGAGGTTGAGAGGAGGTTAGGAWTCTGTTRCTGITSLRGGRMGRGGPAGGAGAAGGTGRASVGPQEQGPEEPWEQGPEGREEPRPEGHGPAPGPHAALAAHLYGEGEWAGADLPGGPDGPV